MTIHFEAGDGEPEALLRGMEGLLREVAEELVASTQRVRAGEFGDVKATPKAARDLREAFILVMEERTRVEKLRRQVAGDAGAGGELDLAAARAEIGRRLARLRDAGTGG